MTNLTAVSSISAIIIVVIYGFITLYRSVFKAKGSIKDAERTHRYLLTVGGILIGISLNSLDLGEDILGNTEFYVGVLLAFAGIFCIALAKFYLQSAFYKPLEQISEYSADFGKSFVATQLPQVGVIELKGFSKRFSDNSLNLAQRLSNSEIQLEKLRKGITFSLDNFIGISKDIESLSHLTDRTSEVSSVYNSNINRLQTVSQVFIDWYSSTNETFKNLLSDLRALTNSGNLLAVNAAIESINMEEENPGITTIADKLHDLAKDLEEKYESLQSILINMDEKYEDFNISITGLINESDIVKKNSEDLTDDIGVLISNLKTYDEAIQTQVDGIQTNLADVIAELPSY